MAMYAASSKLSSSGCLLSTFSSYRKWVHHFAVTLPLQQRKSFQSSCVTRVPRRFVGLPCSISPLRVVPAQLTSTRLLVVALNDKRGNGSTNTDGMSRFSCINSSFISCIYCIIDAVVNIQVCDGFYGEYLSHYIRSSVG